MKISLIFVLAFFGGFLAFWIRGVEGGLSYEAGFWSFICIFLSLYFSIKPKITNPSLQENRSGVNKKNSFAQKMSMGLGLSFSFFRIIAYAGLVGVLLVLIEKSFFDVYAYMIGVFLGLCGTFAWILF